MATVLVVGVVGALPFMRQNETPALPQHLPPPNPASVDVPLHMGADSGPSPAVGLHDAEPTEDPPPRVAPPSIGRSRLEDHGLPPDLPDRYTPLLNRQESARQSPAEQPRVRTHRIIDGDSLAKLAQRYYHDAALAAAIYAANRDVLSAPDPLPLGVTLRIPPRPAAEASPPENARPEPLPVPVKQPTLEGPGNNNGLVPIPAGVFDR